MDFLGVDGELFRFTEDFLFNLLGVLDGGGRILEERPQVEAPPGDFSCGVCIVLPVLVSHRPCPASLFSSYFDTKIDESSTSTEDDLE